MVPPVWRTCSSMASMLSVSTMTRGALVRCSIPALETAIHAGFGEGSVITSPVLKRPAKQRTVKSLHLICAGSRKLNLRDLIGGHSSPECAFERSSRGEPPSGLRREERMRVETAECSLARNEPSLPNHALLANEISNEKRASRQLSKPACANRTFWSGKLPPVRHISIDRVVVSALARAWPIFPNPMLA